MSVTAHPSLEPGGCEHGARARYQGGHQDSYEESDEPPPAWDQQHAEHGQR